MRTPEGKAVLAVIGLGVMAVGCYFAFKGASAGSATTSPSRAAGP